MQLTASVINILFNQALSRYGGDAAIGAFGIINTLVMFILMPVFGINQGAQPIIGFNYGAQQYERVKETIKKAIITATLIATAGFLVLHLFPAQLLRAFTSDQKLLQIGTHGMYTLLLALPVVGFQIVSANFFQAIGKAAMSMMLSMLRQVIVLIPLLLFLPRYFQLDGVWYAAPISDITAALVTAIFLLRELRNLDREKLKLERSIEEQIEGA